MSARFLTTVMGVLLLLGAAFNAPAADGPSAGANGPSAADVRAAIDRGEYASAAKMASQALRRCAGAAQRAERYELLMLKGEALTDAGSPAYAAYAFEAAARAAVGTDQLAAARAESLLAGQAVRRSPKPAPAPVPPPNLEMRKGAMRELYGSFRSPLEPKVLEAATGNTLPPMYDLLPSLLDLSALELTADGSLERTLPLLRQLGDRARQLIGDELDRINAEIDRIELSAGEIEFVGSGGIVGRRGLYTADRKALEKMLPYLARIESVTRDGRGIGELVRDPEGVEAWKDLGIRASDASAHVDSALSRRH